MESTPAIDKNFAVWQAHHLGLLVEATARLRANLRALAYLLTAISADFEESGQANTLADLDTFAQRAVQILERQPAGMERAARNRRRREDAVAAPRNLSYARLEYLAGNSSQSQALVLRLVGRCAVRIYGAEAAAFVDHLQEIWTAFDRQREVLKDISSQYYATSGGTGSVLPPDWIVDSRLFVLKYLEDLNYSVGAEDRPAETQNQFSGLAAEALVAVEMTLADLDPLSRVRVWGEIQKLGSVALQESVNEARRGSVPWQKIADALELSQPAALRKFDPVARAKHVADSRRRRRSAENEADNER